MERWRVVTGWGLAVIVLGMISFGAWLIAGHFSRPQATVTIGAAAFRVSVARTEAEREKGLSGVTGLKNSEGMLFIFPSDGPQSMWMKDMKVNLDIIWLDEAKKVVYIEHDLTPESYPKTYASPKPARYVLEVSSGTAAQSGITLGKTASFDLP